MRGSYSVSWTVWPVVVPRKVKKSAQVHRSESWRVTGYGGLREIGHSLAKHRNVEKMEAIYSSIVPYVPREFTSDPIYAKPDDEQLEGAKTLQRARREAREEAKKSAHPSETNARK